MSIKTIKHSKLRNGVPMVIFAGESADSRLGRKLKYGQAKITSGKDVS